MIPTCPICGHRATLLFREMTDRQYGVPHQVDLHLCQGDRCGHAFVFPQPTKDQIAGFYANYSTHASIRPARKSVALYNAVVDALAAFDGFGEQKRGVLTMGLHAEKIGCLLDVGCGSGGLLRRMRDSGWTNIYGTDFDPAAAATARAAGLDNIFVGSVRDLPASAPAFDYISFNHVIEHLPDPVADLQEALRRLAPGGKVIIRTPNSRSLLRHLFGRAWRGWEAPRHIHVFTPESMRKLAQTASCSKVEIHTSNGMLQGMLVESIAPPVKRTRFRLLQAYAAYPFIVVVAALSRRIFGTGEEIVATLGLSTPTWSKRAFQQQLVEAD